MSIKIAVPRETRPGERRVALVPEVVARLVKQGVEVVVERQAGAAAYQDDAAYESVGARLHDGGPGLFADCRLVLRVTAPDPGELAAYPQGCILVALLQPHSHPEVVAALRDRGITSFAMELLPRISRAQSMDALSSQATVAGYKAALIAAERCPRFFPMLTTAAGTIRPARVLIIGAGVAGLQAIATARRLGAVVEAYDVRPAAREQVESLGARFLRLDIDAEAEGGYARELTADEKVQEQAMLREAIVASDVVITTAQIPGRPAPRMVSADMVEAMKPGAVVIDMAAESGGNCELSELGREVEHGGVLVYGPENLPSQLPVHASEMYSRNLFRFIGLMLGDEARDIHLDWDDEIIASSVVTHDGEIRHAPTREIVGGLSS